MPRIRLLATMLLTVFIALPLTAQGSAAVAAVPAGAPESAAASGMATGPRLEAVRAGVSVEAPSPALPPAPAPLERKSSTGLMIFGGAAFVTGILVGGDVGTIVTIGGAGVFLYGLWRYLK